MYCLWCRKHNVLSLAASRKHNVYQSVLSGCRAGGDKGQGTFVEPEALVVSSALRPARKGHQSALEETSECMSLSIGEDTDADEGS